MDTIEYRASSLDKSAWGSGPWHDEPDSVHWFGFDCAHSDDLVPAIRFTPSDV